jgi:hypothetical protein
MLALAKQERDTNALGIPVDVATDPANQFRFVTRRPITDWSLRTIAADQKKFYEDAEKAAGEPVSSAGHIWSAYLRDDPTTE